MPVFQPYNSHLSHHPAAQAIQNFPQHLTLAQHPGNAVTAATLNYPAINFAMPYAPYPATFSLPCKI